MDLEKTFELSELDEAFWKKVVYVEIWNSSGMGGPGCLWIMTEEKKIYNIGFDGFPHEGHLEMLHPLLRREQCENHCGRTYRYAAEQNGWKYFIKANALVREDLFEAFEAVWEAAYEWNNDIDRYVFGPQVMGVVLGADGEMERWDDVISARIRREKQELIHDMEEERRRNKLTEEFFVWKPRYWDNRYSESLCQGFLLSSLKRI